MTGELLIDYLYSMMKDFNNFAVMVIGSRIYQGVNQNRLLISPSPVEPLELINNSVHKGDVKFKSFLATLNSKALIFKRILKLGSQISSIFK